MTSNAKPTKPSFYQRHARTILIVAAILVPFGLFGMGKAIQSNKNRIIDWLPKNFAETQRLLWFVDTFGSDEILAVSWSECTIHAESVDQFVEALRKPTTFAGTTRPIFREVISGRSVLEEMTSEPLELPESLAKSRMSGWLLGEDGESTCIIARIVDNKDGSYSRIHAVQFVKDSAEQLGIPASELKIAGPTADSVAIDNAGTDRINLFRFLSVALGMGLAWLSLRDVGHVGAVFITALIATLFSFSSVYWLGFNMDAVLLPLPALIFVLTISGGIHLSHYFRDAAKEHPIHSLPAVAIKVGWLPCTLAAITTFVGLISLSISQVVPVARFGILSAIGVIISLITLMTVWPACAQLLCTRRPVEDKPEHSDSDATAWWQPVFRMATRLNPQIVLLILVAYPILSFGLSRTNTSVHLHSLLPAKSSLLKSYGSLEEPLGPLVPVEVVLSFPQVDDPQGKIIYERAKVVESLRTKIDALPESGGTFAATSFMPNFPTEQGARQVMMRRVIGKRMLNRRDLLVSRRMIAIDDGQEYWRVSTRVASTHKDYSPFLDSLKTTVDAFVKEQTAAGVTVDSKVCGSVPLIQMAQKQLLYDLIKSFSLAFVCIAVAMIILLQVPIGGLLAMIPNVFPSLLILGTMGFVGNVVDIGIMMTASVALGIAVDDTLHFLVWYRRSSQQGKNQIDAIEDAFSKSASAMLQTSLICGLGMLPFAASSFGPVSRFAGGMVALLFAALLGDLLLLPAILSSPLGRFFTKSRSGGFTVSRASTESLPASQT